MLPTVASVRSLAFFLTSAAMMKALHILRRSSSTAAPINGASRSILKTSLKFGATAGVAYVAYEIYNQVFVVYLIISEILLPSYLLITSSRLLFCLEVGGL